MNYVSGLPFNLIANLYRVSPSVADYQSENVDETSRLNDLIGSFYLCLMFAFELVTLIGW